MQEVVYDVIITMTW